eukprot:symbB.v1.2.032200.t1/scaffold3832.1/size57148/2
MAIGSVSPFSSGHPETELRDAMVKTSLLTLWVLVALSPLAAAGPSQGRPPISSGLPNEAVQPTTSPGAFFQKIRHFFSGISSVANSHKPLSDCYYIFGLSKFSWAFICDLLALAVILLCIPLLLSCSKRRPLGASIFEFKLCGSPESVGAKPPSMAFPTYHSFQMN